MKSPFRYYYREVVFINKSVLYRTLAEAVLDYYNHERIIPVPTAHGTLGRLSDFGRGFNWWIVLTQDFGRPGEKPSESLIANFADPIDAFAFATLKTKGKDKWKSYRVELHWPLEDGRTEILEKLPVTWLRDVRRARDRAERKASTAQERAA